MDTLKKLLMATKAATLPDVPGAFRKLSQVMLLTSVSVLTASPGWAVVLAPTTITVTVPDRVAGTDDSNNSQADGTSITYTGNGGASGAATSALSNSGQTISNPFVDDILLSSITFAGTTINSTSTPATNGIRPGLSNSQGTGAFVSFGRDFISATYGGTSTTATTRDTSSDGNPNPYVTSSGNANAVYVAPGPNAQTPANQDAAIQAAFSSLSLSQGINSPGNTAIPAQEYTFRLLFENGIVDNNLAASPTSATPDNVPELIIFERGISTSTPDNRSEYTVRAITGGTLTNPTYGGSAVQILRANQTPSGIFINTVDPALNDVEPINLAALDLNELGITTANQVLYGIEITSNNNTGADIFGLALTAANPTAQFKAQALPEPLTIIGSGVALGFGLLMKREHSRKRQNEQS